MTEENSSNALVKVRALFLAEQGALTLSIISQKTGLKPSAVSMALRHLLKQRYVTRGAIPNHTFKGRKEVWLYQYHPNKVMISE